MGSAYDRKFEEMKMYIPFLENMIKRLESTGSSSSNPRQAQLDKIRSLRDLLLDKKKRMKMENLLKCEQVLVNLYAKVEQRDGFANNKSSEMTDGKNKEPPDLETVRNKLKTVAKIQEKADTLPEIARASEIEESCTPGSKEPALFQRRPNKNSISPEGHKRDLMSPPDKPKPQSKRNYTRVLLSPDPTAKRWNEAELVNSPDKPLFCRRSPRRSPRRYSPTYHKKEKKKSKNKKSKDLNITLNVPEESLDSLNTKDILSRIINCSDGDVDIDTLRELRSQILGELKQTGTNDDISDLILKSYKKKSKTVTKVADVEEGEISDSESEAIESIYGSLVVVDKDKNKASQVKTAADKRKIQICLVINSDKDEKANNTCKPVTTDDTFDLTDCVTDNKKDTSTIKDVITIDTDSSANTSPTKPTKQESSVNTVEVVKKIDFVSNSKPSTSTSSKITLSPKEVQSDNVIDLIPTLQQLNTNSSSNIVKLPKEDQSNDIEFLPTLEQLNTNSSNITNSPKKDQSKDVEFFPTLKQLNSNSSKTAPVPEVQLNNFDILPTPEQTKSNKEVEGCSPTKNIANFYKPINDDKEKTETIKTVSNMDKGDSSETPKDPKPQISDEKAKDTTENPEECKVSQKPKVSEIDILQALKNEILSETILLPASETGTPALHQPKITKVASAQEILPKKRISIENYKQKSVSDLKPNVILFRRPPRQPKKTIEEIRDKKQSLKLTEKECERFNFPVRSSLDENDLSDNELLDENLQDEYLNNDFAPKSPDNEDVTSSGNTTPVIIPVDPVKTVSIYSDVDMRIRPPLLPPPVPPPEILPMVAPVNTDKPVEINRTALIDPRKKKELLQPHKASPNPYNPLISDTVPKPVPFPPVIPPHLSLTPSYTPSYTPSIPPLMSLTPNARSFDMTPSHQPFDVDEPSLPKHVYAPSFPFDADTSRDEPNVDLIKSVPFDDHSQTDRYRYQGSRREYSKPDCPTGPSYSWTDCPATPGSSFGRQEGSMTPTHSFGRLECPTTPVHHFGRSDCPSTPVHHFGRSECPSTPIHSFGRSDCPSTPVHPFGRSDCPSTPIHPFGRSECPSTPIHPFGRSECPSTPNPSFGRSDCPMTPSHPFGRGDTSLSSNHQYGHSEVVPEISTMNQNYRKDPRLNRRFENDSRFQYKDRNQGFHGERILGRRNQHDSNYKHSDARYDRERRQEFNSRDYDRERRESRRDHSLSRDYEADQLYSRSRYDYKSGNKYEERGSRYRRETSVGRSMCEERPRANSRAPSVGRNSQTIVSSRSDNSVSVLSNTGRSFRIDTSVNTSFQKLIETGKGLKVFDYTFLARRDRAASVGRSIVRETSVGRTMNSNISQSKDKNERMKRASSVGRELSKSDENKSRVDLKAEFLAFKEKICKESNRKFNKDDTHSRKDKFDQRVSKVDDNTRQPYSPRKNNRDPRLRREQNDPRQRNRNSYDSHDRRQGIVYSNDNIAKGTTMGPSFGVKNYKIPKIKRPEPVPEPPKIEVKEKEEKRKAPEKESIKKDKAAQKESNKKITAFEKKEITAHKNKDDQVKNKPRGNEKKKPIEFGEEMDKRVTRSRSDVEIKSEGNTDRKTQRQKKPKKGTVIDSDSDFEQEITKKKVTGPKETPKLTDIPKAKQKINEETIVATEKIEKTIHDTFDANFDEDGLALFSENMVSDPVIDNINALIADLDHDLDERAVSPKEIEKMLDSIDSPEENSLTDISEFIENDLNETEQLKQAIVANTSKSKLESVDSIKDSIFDDLKKDHSKEEISPLIGKATNSINTTIQPNIVSRPTQINTEAIVSTTDTSHDSLKLNENSNDISASQSNSEVRATPDSTIKKNDTCDKFEESLPDSTNELSNPASAVTSSHDTETAQKESIESSASKNVTQLESIGSLLSILQDKSKLKEILSMLGDQSGESEKIKKKLEKLSEIVSDDDSDEKTEMQSSTSKKEQSTKTSEELLKNKEDELQKMPEEEILEKNEITVIQLQSSEVQPVKETNEPILKELIRSDVQKEILSEADKDLKKEESASQTEKSNNIENEQANIDDERTTAEKREQDETTNETETIKKKPEPKKRGGKKLQPKKGKAVPPAIAKTKTKPYKSRELKKLQDDIKEMFISQDVLNATGIRMCRLAKLVEDKIDHAEDLALQESGPVVVLEKCKLAERTEEIVEKVPKKVRKKPGPKPKIKIDISEEKPAKTSVKMNKPKILSKYKPGPKSKQKIEAEIPDPYEFDLESFTDSNTTKESDDDPNSDDQSLASSTRSLDSNDILADIKKKPKRKRPGWQAGVIKTKSKKKPEIKPTEQHSEDLDVETSLKIPDYNCFTDKNYCFRKQRTYYSCRLCEYSGPDIVNHYKKQHPHTEIPLSRLEPAQAKFAIKQCEQINFQAISNMASNSYKCRFCHKEFNKGKQVLEIFFWHIVSKHTGEYKQTCSECVTETSCPFNLDIPPPPKDLRGQIIGYICGKCNFTQISLENLKTHVIVRHNDEQTEVYTINLAVMPKKIVKTLIADSKTSDEPRMLRSRRSNVSITSDDASNITGSELDEMSVSQPCQSDLRSAPYKSKITFENDDIKIDDIKIDEIKIDEIKKEKDRVEISEYNQAPDDSQALIIPEVPKTTETEEREVSKTTSKFATKTRPNTDEVSDKIHFKMHFTKTGSKEYVCCINGNDHYKTTLLISMKKHVQNKHAESWDGYCAICKAIVTLQGVKCLFKDCLMHYLTKHIDDFPVLEPIDEPETVKTVPEKPASPAPLISVRPLAELIAKEINKPSEDAVLPRIENVVSLGEPVQEPPVYPMPVEEPPESEKPFQYEEIQADVMSKKHRVVLDVMMTKEALIRVFKCAGRFCSFTSDSAEDALVHASTHQRVGSDDALRCSYCNFDSSGNAIDLVMHVFKEHSRCQYVCSLCFYRGAAAQLVGAHFTKAHANSGKPLLVLRNATAGPPDEVSMPVLSRQDAVPYYVCHHGQGACKFRHYIPGKFCEHLMTKHGKENLHPCYLCPVMLPSGADLVQHMKSHGLRLYHCIWCVHGACSELELLAHVASKHPSQQPKAYLRIITSKEGSSELRVLPLAYLNKTQINTEQVQPSHAKENPVREAERSIDLEKLIGQANVLANIVTPNTTVNDNVPVPEPSRTPVIPQAPVIAEVPVIPQVPIVPEVPAITDVPVISQVNAVPQVAAIPHVTETPEFSGLATIDVPVLETIPPVVEPTNIKVETEISTPQVSDVICLDSDDESPTQTPTKQPESSQTPKELEKEPDNALIKIPENRLLKCPFCPKPAYKAKIGLTKHIRSYHSYETGAVMCPHKPCNFKAETLLDLFSHYSKHSSRKLVQYLCQLCNTKCDNSLEAKSHLKQAHHINTYMFSAKNVCDGVTTVVFGTTKPNKIGLKRKSSAEKRTSVESAKRPSLDIPKKYGIDDIDKLPLNPILDTLVYCDLCEFSTKVRLNMIRHLQLHANKQSVPQTEPVNPVPHLETNEMHFDKMLNLASSSIVTRAPEKSRDNMQVSVLIAPQVASQYPKFVPERHRLTCGARGCTYISVDEGMLRRHWEALHSGTTDYHCVHCPPHQHLDTSKTLTASHIIAHLKMHDMALYACSLCTYYHYKQQAVEKHLSEHHKGGQVVTVREVYTPTAQSPQGQVAAPTMDLKPWQCGLCNFKSMLRPEVVEHCAKVHQSKMQYKCGYCPFRTSALENISKHQTNSHTGKPENVFYYYYKEGSIPNMDDIPVWQRQSHRNSLQKAEAITEVKSEPEPETSSETPLSLDLNIVKKEVPEQVQELSIEELCKKYGQFCDPNGIKYKCCLCSVVMEHTREEMQSHLYEELNYRRWSCGVCNYKAFHRAGLNEHITSEHSRQYTEPTMLPPDNNIEKWVTSFLDHQTTIIQTNKANFAKQKIIMEKPAATVSKVAEPPKTIVSTEKELEEAFGSFGDHVNGEFCCPKCGFMIKDESEMRNHLESELTKIRWFCSSCPLKFQTYHEVQFHCKSHNPPARPREAIRDPVVRSDWVTAVINTQKRFKDSSDFSPEKSDDENSLLVVRYAEDASLDERESVTRKRPIHSPNTTDESDEPLVKRLNERKCRFCDFSTKVSATLREHVLRHYNLKPYSCSYCPYTDTKLNCYRHNVTKHPKLVASVKPTPIPKMIPSDYAAKKNVTGKICLTCDKTVEENEVHLHNNEVPMFGNKGDKVVRCSRCFIYVIDVPSMLVHHNSAHPYEVIHYRFVKLGVDSRVLLNCHYCPNFRCTSLKYLKIHHTETHATKPLKYTTVPYAVVDTVPDDDSPKRTARKSTTKLPFNTVAKKSTTKLPMSDIGLEEYSYYGTEPLPLEQYSNVTIKMPVYNSIVDLDMKKLSGILKIDPKVIVSDVNKNFNPVQ